MVPIDSAAEPGGSSRRVPRRLTFDSEPFTIHDLLAQDASAARADPGSPSANARSRAAGGVTPAPGPPSRARRWASFMAPIAVVAAGLASLPAAPPGGVNRAAKAGVPVVPASLPVDASHARMAQATGTLDAAMSSGEKASVDAAAAVEAEAQAGATRSGGALPHAVTPAAAPESSPLPDAVPNPGGALPALGAPLDARPAFAAVRQSVPNGASRAERPTEGAVQAATRAPAAASSRAGHRESMMPAPGSSVQPARTGSVRSASDLFEPAASRGGSQRSTRFAAGGLTRVQAHQCGHLGALPRGFCEQRVQLTYCTGRYGRTGDCPLPTIAMPN